MADLAKLVEDLSGLTVLEASQLTKMLEEKWGVSAAAPVAMGAMMPGMGAAVAAAPVEEKTEFNVVIKDVGPKKINVIKVVRQLTTLGLKEAKDLVDGAPKAVKEAIPKKDAEDILKQITDAGGKAEIK
jgi:large subunit ribosomal protein L7/L12